MGMDGDVNCFDEILDLFARINGVAVVLMVRWVMVNSSKNNLQRTRAAST